MLKNTFCSSPWFHLRINPAGYYLPCRWDFSGFQGNTSTHNIIDTSLEEYMNSKEMCDLRIDILNGNRSKTCQSCYYEDQHNKVSGRQRQLLKSGIQLDKFDKTFCASPHWDRFEYSHVHQGKTNSLPVDLQIDLGNNCNSACIMCNPGYSSRLVPEYTKLNSVEPDLFKIYSPSKNWTDDESTVDKFVDDLSRIPNIKYIHFLGGETLHLKSFYDICNRLVDLNISQEISIGTTTNCTVYNNQIEKLLGQFKNVHLGLSIEANHPVNDYIRWPSNINQIISNIDKFVALRKTTGLHLSLRITPNVLSMYHLDTIFKYMLENSIIAESCNILQDPSWLRIELLPDYLIDASLKKINALIDKYNLQPNDTVIVNRRRDDISHAVINDVIFEYKHILETYSVPDNVEQDRHNLVKFLRAFEGSRNNNILTYLPEYEEFLRSYGY